MVACAYVSKEYRNLGKQFPCKPDWMFSSYPQLEGDFPTHIIKAKKRHQLHKAQGLLGSFLFYKVSLMKHFYTIYSDAVRYHILDPLKERRHSWPFTGTLQRTPKSLPNFSCCLRNFSPIHFHSTTDALCMFPNKKYLGKVNPFGL